MSMITINTTALPRMTQPTISVRQQYCIIVCFDLFRAMCFQEQVAFLQTKLLCRETSYLQNKDFFTALETSQMHVLG